MGIKELLRFMKPFIHPVHIQKYKGRRVGIDAYSWLHKGAYACSMEICMNQSWGDVRAPFVQYFMHRINLLRHHKIVPVVIFDGGAIPCKSATELERERRRATNLGLAKQKLSQGDVPAAIDFFQKAVSITPSTAHQLIQILKTEEVEFIVAPYEADAQLAYLSKLEETEGGISAVITEDSDLLAYGCRAVIFKMDRYGHGEEILMDDVLNSSACGLSFRNFDQELFTGMCVLAGCDFLPSITGIGIKKAHWLVSKYRNLDRFLYAHLLSTQTSRMAVKLEELLTRMSAPGYTAMESCMLLSSSENAPKGRDASRRSQMINIPIVISKFPGSIAAKTWPCKMLYCLYSSLIKVGKCRKVMFKTLEKPLQFFVMPLCDAFFLSRYDSKAKVLMPMKELPQKLVEELDNDVKFLGPMFDPSTAVAIAEGHINPITLETFCSSSPQINVGEAGNSFTIFCAKEMRLDASTERGTEKATHEATHNPEHHDERFIREAVALGSLYGANSAAKSSQILMEDKVVAFPDDNPFSNKKKRKIGDGVVDERFTECKVSVALGDLLRNSGNENGGDGDCGGCSNGTNALGNPYAANSADKSSQILRKEKALSFPNNNTFSKKKRKKGDEGASTRSENGVGEVLSGSPSSITRSDDCGNASAAADSNSDGVDALGSLSAANATAEGSQIVTREKSIGCLDDTLFRNKQTRKKDDHGTDENLTEGEAKVVLREPLSCVTSDEDSGNGGNGLVNYALVSDSQKSVNSRPAKTNSRNRRFRKVVSGKDGPILKFFTRL